MLEGEMEKLVKMEGSSTRRVVGQDEALNACGECDYGRSRAGLSDPKRPIGSFIFLGPTGVARRRTARACGVLFDDEAALVRIRLIETWDACCGSVVIGASGYVGYDEEGS